MHRSLHPFAFVAFLISAHTVPAQARQSVTGHTDTGSEPQSVRVVLEAYLVPGDPLSGTVDRLEVPADARGRFRADVLPGRSYVAFAVLHESGREYRVTNLAYGVTAGRPVRLTERSETLRRPRIEFQGRDSLGAYEPLQFWVRTRAGSYGDHVGYAFDPKGEFPLVPASSCELFVTAKDGRLLHDYRLLLSKSSQDKRARRQAAASRDEIAERKVLHEPDGRIRVVLGPPVPILVQVTEPGKKKGGGLLGFLFEKKKDSDALAAITGARIYAHTPRRRFLIGTTGAGGFAKIDVFLKYRQSSSVIVEADGHSEQHVQLDLRGKKPGRDLQALLEKKKPDITVRPVPGKPFSGRIVLPGGSPCAGAVLLLYSSVSAGAYSTRGFGSPWTFRTDEGGRFRLPSRRAGIPYRLSLILDEKVRAKLSGDGPGIQPEVPLAQGNRPPPQPLDLDLAAFRRLDLRAPLMQPEILVASFPEGQDQDDIGVSSYLADRRGRVSLLLPPRDRWYVGAVSEEGMGFVALERARWPESELEMPIRSPIWISGTLKNQDDQPLYRSRVSAKPVGGRHPELSLLEAVHHYRDLVAPTVDAAGRFRLAVPAPGVRYRLKFIVAMVGGGSMWRGEWVRTVEVDKEGLEGLEFVLNTGFEPAKPEGETDRKGKKK